MWIAIRCGVVPFCLSSRYNSPYSETFAVFPTFYALSIPVKKHSDFLSDQYVYLIIVCNIPHLRYITQ